MIRLPCKNPACRSHGVPHPNCRCYGMAKGGAVSRYCDDMNPHKPDCEYFADGGQVSIGQGDDPQQDLIGALAHGGASTLFSKEGYHSAFGSKKSPLAALNGTEEQNNYKKFKGRVDNGHKTLHKALRSLFHGEAFPDLQETSPDSLKDVIANGGAMSQIESSQEDPLSTSLMGHNIALNEAKGRVSGYLDSVRPHPNESKLPYDPGAPGGAKEREYKRALHIAVQPMSVLKKVQEGRLTPSDVKHFVSMYPELYGHLKHKVGEKVLESQLEGKKPSHQIRQTLSLLFGAHLDSSVLPQTIQAAQMTFQSQQPPAAPQQGKNKKSTSTLTKASEQYATRDQKSQMRGNQ